MRNIWSGLAWVFVVWGMGISNGYALEVVSHELNIVLSPQQHKIAVEDQIVLPPGLLRQSSVEFKLHRGLKPRIKEAQFQLTLVTLPQKPGVEMAGNRPEHYRVQLPRDGDRFTLVYAGEIHHPVSATARGLNDPLGHIAPEGVYLDGSSYWYPVFARDRLMPQKPGMVGSGFEHVLVNFKMSLKLPPEWMAVSQGTRTENQLVNFARDGLMPQKPGMVGSGQEKKVTWEIDKPQDEIYLSAAPFVEYVKKTGEIEAQVFLRQAEPALAQKYLEATHQYLSLYENLIGPYPYSKFALVENFWETGYGMPSFTLLGSKVIRFPFIILSSYPHEILHNWWGNSVYVDYASGNWAEGLTSYLADYLFKEQHGQGADYRRNTLQKYADFAHGQRDFALTEFHSRHDSATEAVGYGKTLMFFHMLRRQMGDDLFRQSLRQLYSEYQFKVASFKDLNGVFNRVTQLNWDQEFSQWVQRIGAPALSIRQVKVKSLGSRYQLSGWLEQTQAAPPYSLQVPVAVYLHQTQQAVQKQIKMLTKTQFFEIDVPERPVRIDIDPEFDVFRRLDQREIPPALSLVMGSEKILMILPSGAAAPLRDAYSELVKTWQQSSPGQIESVWDNALSKLPTAPAIWLLGWDNKFRNTLDKSLRAYSATISQESAKIQRQNYSRNRHTVVLATRHSKQKNQGLAWIATDNIKSMAGLARKLPHYSRYSFLAFEGDAPNNIAKGTWPVTQSPLSVNLLQNHQAVALSASASLAPRPALAEMPSAELPPAKIHHSIAEPPSNSVR